MLLATHAIQFFEWLKIFVKNKESTICTHTESEYNNVCGINLIISAASVLQKESTISTHLNTIQQYFWYRTAPNILEKDGKAANPKEEQRHTNKI